MNEAEQKLIVNAMASWMAKHLEDKLKAKIQEKIAKKLGLASWNNLITGSFPAAKLATFGSGMLKFLTFHGYSSVHVHDNLTQYHPKKQEDQYIEYLLYSWAVNERPGYKPDPILFADFYK